MSDEQQVRRPHDVFFKETFGRPDVAGDFLRNYLPVLLTMKHIFDGRLLEVLPRVLRMVRDWARQETGLEYLYVPLRFTLSDTELEPFAQRLSQITELQVLADVQRHALTEFAPSDFLRRCWIRLHLERSNQAENMTRAIVGQQKAVYPCAC